MFTGADNLEPGAPAEVYEAVVIAWLDEYPALRRPESARRAETPSHDDLPTGKRYSLGAGTAEGDEPILRVAAVDAAPDVSVDGASLAPAPDALRRCRRRHGRLSVVVTRRVWRH